MNRSASLSTWRPLPPAKPFKRPPPLPRREPAWSASTRAWWKTLWASPMASVYLEADVEPLVRLAGLVERADSLTPTEMVAMTALEDRFEQARTGRPVEVPKLRVVDG